MSHTPIVVHKYSPFPLPITPPSTIPHMQQISFSLISGSEFFYMAFDSSFRGPFPYLSSFSPENLCLKQEIETMFPLLNSTPIPPPSLNPHFHSPNTNFHQYFQDPTLNVAYSQSPVFVIEGTHSSITNANDFYAKSTPCLGESSLTNGSIRDFINPHSSVTFAANTKMDALLGHHNGQVIWDFDQKSTFQTAAAASSYLSLPSEPPSPVADEYVSRLKARFEEDLALFTGIDHWDTDYDGQRWQNKRVRGEDDGSFANTHKGTWTPEEDKALVKLVKEHGQKKWSRIARSLHDRVGKQCRERWHNHLRPDIRKDSWTVDEDVTLIKAHQEVGNKWVEIAKRLPGRSENTIKNHWNATKRRRNLKKTRKPNASDGSVLQSYIKMVTTANEDAAKELEKSIRRMNMLRCCNELVNLVRGGELSDDEEFNSEEENEEELGLMSQQQHHVFTASGNDSKYPPSPEMVSLRSIF